MNWKDIFLLPFRAEMNATKGERKVAGGIFRRNSKALDKLPARPAKTKGDSHVEGKDLRR